MSDERTEEAESSAAREEMEVARVEVVETEKKIQNIKEALRRIALSGDKDKTNSLSISALKVTGLPPSATPSFNLQLSSPVEELTLSKINDPLSPDEDGTFVTFKGVETSMAMLTVKVNDADFYLGSSKCLEVATWCSIDDALNPADKVSEVEVDIFEDEYSGETVGKPVVESKVESEGKEGDSADVSKKEEITVDESKTVEQKKEESNDDSAKIDESEKDEKASPETTDESKKEEQIPEKKADEIKKEESKTEVEPDESAKEEPKSDEKKEEAKDESPTSENKETENETKSSTETTAPATAAPPTAKESASQIPLATLTLQIKYTSSPSDQKDELYLLLNKTSKLKAVAMDKLRKCAVTVSRTRASALRNAAKTDASPASQTVKPGFLNKKQKSKGGGGVLNMLTRWYEVTVGPQSFARRVFPVVKNYGLFFGVVVLMHYKGQELALPAPV